MCARIFYGSYNAVAMHRIVMCKSSGDKHIDCRAWAGSGRRRCFMEVIGSALQGAAWLQCCPSPAQGCWQGNLPPPTAGQWDIPCGLSCGQGLLWKGHSKVPLKSWGHHSSGKNDTAEVDNAAKAKPFSCCHTAKFVLQRWNLNIALHWSLMWSEGIGVKGEMLPVLGELLGGRIRSYLGCL